MSKLLAALVYQEVFYQTDITTFWCNWTTWKYRAVG